MTRKGRAPLLLVLGLCACDASCGKRDRKILGKALAAHDCPPDVATCIGGEAYLSVGAMQAEGDPCRQLSLGACSAGCVAEGVAISYGADQATVRAQLCAPPRGTVLAQPVAPLGDPAEVRCEAGVVHTGREAARCDRGCATDDVLTDESLGLEQAIRLFCRR